jgi:hypothetical protein
MGVYKTVMGTIPWISSHPSFTAEAVYDVRLLLFWSAVFPDAGSGFTALGFPDLPFTAEPSGCPFFPPERDFRDEVSFRPWDQFPKESHQFREIVTEVSFS